MSALLRFALPLLGYLCAGTVIAAGVGYGYLRYAGVIDDEKLFRIAALVHNVDLEELEETAEYAESDVPPEEPSYDEQQERLQVATLHFDAKQKQLAESLSNFDYELKRLNSQTSRYEVLKNEVEQFLKEQSTRASDDALQRVVKQMEQLVPSKQAKPLVEQMITVGRIDEVILILDGMNARARNKLLLAFDKDDEDIDLLYQIQEAMLRDDPVKRYVDGRLDELARLKNQEN